MAQMKEIKKKGFTKLAPRKVVQGETFAQIMAKRKEAKRLGDINEAFFSKHL